MTEKHYIVIEDDGGLEQVIRNCKENDFKYLGRGNDFTINGIDPLLKMFSAVFEKNGQTFLYVDDYLASEFYLLEKETDGTMTVIEEL